MKNSVWRELVDVPGPAEFFELLNDRIRTTDDRELLTAYLQVLAGEPSTEDDSNNPYVQNSDDRHWIHQQITQIQTNQRGQEKGKSKRKPSGAKIPKRGLTMRKPMSTGSGEPNDQQIDPKSIADSNKVEADSNSGLLGSVINIQGSVTINNYPKDSTKPSTQEKSDSHIPSEDLLPSQFESGYRSTYYRDREMITREINQEFDLCPALAHAFDINPVPKNVKDYVIEQFVTGEKPADWLLDRVMEKYDQGSLATDELHRGLKRLLILSLIVQMPPDVHELLSMEILRVKSNDAATHIRQEIDEKDVGTRDREFIALSIASAISATSSDLKSNKDFLIDIVQELIDDDWSQKLNNRHLPSRIRPFDFASEGMKFVFEPSAMRSRDLDENLKILCRDLLDAVGQTIYASQSEIDVLNKFLDRFSKPHDFKLQLFALILPVEYFQNLIASIREKLPKLLVVPVSNRRDEEFQHLRMILDQTTRILHSARKRK